MGILRARRTPPVSLSICHGNLSRLCRLAFLAQHAHSGPLFCIISEVSGIFGSQHAAIYRLEAMRCTRTLRFRYAPVTNSGELHGLRSIVLPLITSAGNVWGAYTLVCRSISLARRDKSQHQLLHRPSQCQASQGSHAQWCSI